MEEQKFDFRSIKTYEDACKKLNIDPEKLPDVSMIPEEHRESIINAYKLFIIHQAINDGWKPNWNDSDEEKWFPWMEVKADEERPSGSGFSVTFTYCGCTLSYVGSRLCVDSEEKAQYIADTFQEEYKKFWLFNN